MISFKTNFCELFKIKCNMIWIFDVFFKNIVFSKKKKNSSKKCIIFHLFVFFHLNGRKIKIIGVFPKKNKCNSKLNIVIFHFQSVFELCVQVKWTEHDDRIDIKASHILVCIGVASDYFGEFSAECVCWKLATAV